MRIYVCPECGEHEVTTSQFSTTCDKRLKKYWEEMDMKELKDGDYNLCFDCGAIIKESVLCCDKCEKEFWERVKNGNQFERLLELSKNNEDTSGGRLEETNMTVKQPDYYTDPEETANEVEVKENDSIVKSGSSLFMEAKHFQTPTNKAAKTTLPTDSNERKGYPIFRGCLKYFPAALAGVARISKLGNDKHNNGSELHHARGKSMDHGDCILRHLMDVADLISAKEKGSPVTDQQILDEVSQMTWRALAFSQELHEKIGEAPLAPGAK